MEWKTLLAEGIAEIIASETQKMGPFEPLSQEIQYLILKETQMMLDTHIGRCPQNYEGEHPGTLPIMKTKLYVNSIFCHTQE